MELWHLLGPHFPPFGLLRFGWPKSNLQATVRAFGPKALDLGLVDPTTGLWDAKVPSQRPHTKGQRPWVAREYHSKLSPLLAGQGIGAAQFGPRVV